MLVSVLHGRQRSPSPVQVCGGPTTACGGVSLLVSVLYGRQWSPSPVKGVSVVFSRTSCLHYVVSIISEVMTIISITIIVIATVTIPMIVTIVGVTLVISIVFPVSFLLGAFLVPSSMVQRCRVPRPARSVVLSVTCV